MPKLSRIFNEIIGNRLWGRYRQQPHVALRLGNILQPVDDVGELLKQWGVWNETDYSALLADGTGRKTFVQAPISERYAIYILYIVATSGDATINKAYVTDRNIHANDIEIFNQTAAQSMLWGYAIDENLTPSYFPIILEPNDILKVNINAITGNSVFKVRWYGYKQKIGEIHDV